MQDNGILKTEMAIEMCLENAGRPVEEGELLRTIRDIDLREAVWNPERNHPPQGCYFAR